jgi:hypothetical protein
LSTIAFNACSRGEILACGGAGGSNDRSNFGTIGAVVVSFFCCGGGGGGGGGSIQNIMSNSIQSLFNLPEVSVVVLFSAKIFEN